MPGQCFLRRQIRERAERRALIVEQQLAEVGLRPTRLSPEAISALRERELRRAGEGLAEVVGKPFAQVRVGERIEGNISRRLDLESGSYALVERSRDFTLVPWRDVLEHNLGKPVSGIMRTDGISWQFGRSRSGPSIS